MLYLGIRQSIDGRAKTVSQPMPTELRSAFFGLRISVSLREVCHLRCVGAGSKHDAYG